MTAISSLDELYAGQLCEMLDAEIKSIIAYEILVDAAHDLQLTRVFCDELDVTRDHASRLEQLLLDVDAPAHGVDCEPVSGLLREVEKTAAAEGPSELRDTALIGLAQRIAHYEMAGYGSLRTYATVLGHVEAAALLEESLEEEFDADLSLNEAAEHIYARARTPAPAFQERNP